ncbi:F0F1 ATP synthase subunit alpha [Candidatus Acetothermia bacterium]|nr:F0F1 ATP synthase subunit alpha [Candidatus Acetothermia bacterium]
MAQRVGKDEISAIIKEQIKRFRHELTLDEVGVVVEVGDGIARVFGLERAVASEIVNFPGDIPGLIVNLEEDSVGIALFGDETSIKEGDEVRRSGLVLEVPVGEALLGRIVDPLGQPRDGKKSSTTSERRRVEVKAPSVIQRVPVDTPLQTGLKSIDALTPIGRGQRELIIGDRRTGKTALAIDTIINQKNEGVYCIYVAIGQKTSTVARIVDTLQRYGAMEYTTVVTAEAQDPTPLQYLAPYAGCAMAEYFMYAGKDALIVYDDLSKHAVAYREISLLLRRPPGREAYPGDIFYAHSRLLERAARLAPEHGGGSLTAFPIIETKAGDVTSYIPTNVISITDGQIYLETDLFNQGFRPAINVGLSVSRVGGAAQIAAMKQVAGKLRLELSQYRDLEAFAEFATDLDAQSRAQLSRGERLMTILIQDQYRPMPIEEQVLLLYTAVNNHLDTIAVDSIRRFAGEFLRFLHAEHEGIFTLLRKKKAFTAEIEILIKDAITAFKESFGR